MQTPRLVVVTGPSGVGKGRVNAELLRLMNSSSNQPGLVLSISCTTRSPRPGEVDGQHYHFLSREAFEAKIAAGDFLEWAEYNGNLYGTSREQVDKVLTRGHHVLLEIEVQGARQIKAKVPEALLIFLTPPSLEELERRLRERGTETEAVIQQRLATGRTELEEQDWFDHVVCNQQVSHCAMKIASLL